MRRFIAAVGLFAAVGVPALFPASAWANSKFLNVQGRLTDSSGTPLTGTQTVTFRLYTSSTAAIASAIWTESQAVALSSGLFNVKLGTSTSLDSLAFTQEYYLGMQVAGDANEMSPRQVLGASAYAQGSLGAFNAGGSVGVNGGVTASSATLSGNIAVGGQAVVSGTGTVVGGAFSVGTSTFVVTGGNVGVRTAAPATSLDVAGSAQFGAGVLKSTFAATPGASTYALALASGAKLANGGTLELTSGGYIKWADGSTSTSASAGGGGNALLSATQTWSGGNTFASGIVMNNKSSFTLQAGSTMTAGPASYSTALSVVGRIVGQENLVAVSTGNGLASVTFTGFSGSTAPPSGYYKVMCTGVKHAAGNIYWQANGDTASSYYYYLCGGNISNFCSTEYSWSSANQGRLSGGVENINDGSGFRFEATFHTQKTNSIVMAPFVATYTNGGSGGNSMNSVQGSSMWDGGSEFSSLKIFFSAGTADMYCFVKQFITSL